MARTRMAHLLRLFSNLCLSSLEKYSRRFRKIWGDIAVYLGKFRIILFFVLKTVGSVFSLESPR